MMEANRFVEVWARSGEKEFTLRLGAIELTVLHGLIAVAMDHPGVQELSGATLEIARKVREGCLMCFREMGFSHEEVFEIDMMRQGRDTGENVRLGPRLVMVGGEALGTADDLSMQVAEATAEELEKLKGAEAITLVKVRASNGDKN